MWGLVPVKGAFREVRGSGTVSPGGTVTGTVTVAAASIDTNNARRDKHLRSADFFDSDNFPDITFTAGAIRPTAQGVTVNGTLTVRDRSQPLSFKAAASVESDHEIQLVAEIRINRADLDMVWNALGAVSMYSTLTIRAVFTRAMNVPSSEDAKDAKDAEDAEDDAKDAEDAE